MLVGYIIYETLIRVVKGASIANCCKKGPWGLTVLKAADLASRITRQCLHQALA